jgi:DNA repair photolyase
MPFPLDIVELRKMFYTVFETDRHFKWRSVMEKRVPLRIGCMSDGFMALDKQFKVTLELLKILKFYKYPYTVVTRSDLVADDEYLAEMDPKLGAIHMSLISCNEKLTRIIEPGAPSPMRRLSAIEKLTKAGFWTVVRINPLFPIYPDGYYSDPNYKKDSAKSFDCFSWDMVDQIAAHGTKSLVAGIVRLYPPNVRFMNKALNADIRDFFPQNTKLERNSIHFSQAETDYYYNRISEQCAQRGIRFSTCYIGNDPTGEAFHRYQGLWANKSDCCDVIGNCSGMKASTADFPVVRKPTCQKACSKRKRRCGGEVEVKNIQQSDCDLPAGSGVYDGINVQFPISNLIMRGEKTVETRTYAIPKGYVGKRMILIETPGRSGKFKARMIGFVTFGDSFEYPTEDAFYADSKRHCVTPESEWRWQAGVRKFGWPVLHVELWDSPVPLKKRSGIKFSKGIEI